jgi:DNA-binding beta-propeller fold protein YncE
MIRRRVTEAGAVAAAVALVATGVTAAAGVFGPAAPWSATSGPAAAHQAAPPVVYAVTMNLHSDAETITPINPVTNQPGKPLTIGHNGNLAAAPDGKTVYFTGGNSVIPISTATGQAGRPIKLGSMNAGWMQVDPNGKIAYVTGIGENAVPVDLTTNKAEKPIKGGGSDLFAFSPDGKTAYVEHPGARKTTVTPLDTTAGTFGKPATLAGGGNAIAISPDGRTLYVATARAVVPISTATGLRGKPIPIRDYIWGMVVSPDGKTMYVSGRKGLQDKYLVTPVDLTTNTAGTPIRVRTAGEQIVITPDGEHVYVASTEAPGQIIPISTATNKAGRPILQVTNYFLAVSPDSKTLYALTGSSVTPISTATGQPGQPIPVRSGMLQELVVTP